MSNYYPPATPAPQPQFDKTHEQLQQSDTRRRFVEAELVRDLLVNTAVGVAFAAFFPDVQPMSLEFFNLTAMFTVLAYIVTNYEK